jgi:hypothetical protein
MLSSSDDALRASCASHLLQFLLDWPLEERRLSQHLSFVVGNLAFAAETGRLQALEFLHAIVTKFPPALLSAKASFLLMPVAARLSAESNAKCRRRLGDIARALTSRVDALRREEIGGWCAKWLQAPDVRLRCVALQLLGSVAVEEGGKGGVRVAGVLPVLEGTLEAHAGSAVDGGGGLQWREAYFALLLVERMGVEGVGVRVWGAVLRLLRHRHLWVQKVAGRVAGGALAQPAAAAELLGLQETAGQLALALYLQLANPAADDAMRLQATKCLVATAPHLPACPPVASAISASDEEDLLNAYDTRLRTPAVTLHGLCKRMAAVASDRRTAAVQTRLAALRWIGAVGPALGRDMLCAEGSAILRLLVLPLYRVQEGSGDDSEEVRHRTGIRAQNEW